MGIAKQAVVLWRPWNWNGDWGYSFSKYAMTEP